MELSNIITQRRIHKEFWYSIVYEWENDLSNNLGCPLYYDKFHLSSGLDYRIRNSPFWGNFIPPFVNSFAFVMSASRPVGNNNRILPCIIDCYPDSDSCISFIKNSYKKNPCIFISSAEVYHFLKKKTNLRLAHLPLSLSDKYYLSGDAIYDKSYDCILVGRSNPVLLDYLMHYVKKNPSFTFATRKKIGNSICYVTNTGRIIGKADTREELLSIMRQARISLYATSNMDGDKNMMSRFHQVTPRFLELVSCACQIIMRYEDNEDTDYYKLNQFGKNVNSYKDFESEMERCLNENVNVSLYSKYLKEHYTSERGLLLKSIIQQL